MDIGSCVKRACSTPCALSCATRITVADAGDIKLIRFVAARCEHQLSILGKIEGVYGIDVWVKDTRSCDIHGFSGVTVGHKSKHSRRTHVSGWQTHHARRALARCVCVVELIL